MCIFAAHLYSTEFLEKLSLDVSFMFRFNEKGKKKKKSEMKAEHVCLL